MSNTTALQEQAKQALPIIQAMINKDPRLKIMGEGTPMCDKKSRIITEFLFWWKIEEIKMPEPPVGEEWHNPKNLTAEQFGVHEWYRPLLVSEVKRNQNADRFHEDIQIWECFRERWDNRGSYGCVYDACYRTNLPLPEPAKELTVAEVEKLLGYPVKIVK